MGIETLKIIVPAIAFVVIFILESIQPLFQFGYQRFKHAGRNLFIFAFNTIILAVISALFLSGLLNYSFTQNWGLLNQFQLPPLLRIILALILFDFWMYIWHRMTHEIPFLWLFHRMHHSEPTMDVTTATRFHIGELLISSILRLGVLILIGMSAWELVLYETLMMPVIYFHHSNFYLPNKIDRFIRSVIVSPWMHWVHHSHLKHETNSNYGTIFSWWDRLANTFRLREKPSTIIYGIEEFQDPYWQTISGMLKTPLLKLEEDYKQDN